VKRTAEALSGAARFGLERYLGVDAVEIRRGQAAALKRLVAAGAQLRAFSPEIMEACYKAAGEIYADLAKTNPHFKKLYESVVPFRNDSYAWFQVAELGFDAFQMRMRTRT
jgi:TRAP-type mannitol/chloroaromatic compound transport system substrate-binding protein